MDYGLKEGIYRRREVSVESIYRIAKFFYEEDRTHGSFKCGIFDIMESSVLLFVVQVVREKHEKQLNLFFVLL